MAPAGRWGSVHGINAHTRLTGVTALKVGLMLDKLRTRAPAIAARSFRPVAAGLVGLALVQMLAACIFSSERPELVLDVPPAYRAGRGVSSPPALDWWRGFRSPELTRLIEEAQTANLDIGAAIGRIMQADAQSKILSAPLFPLIDFEGSASRSKPPGGKVRETYRVALNAAYEIDFWGKNRSASRSAQEAAVASRFDKEVVVLSTIAAVGTAYFQVLAAQDQLRIARSNLTASNRILTLVKQRLDAGTASQLDLSQQESLVATVRATLPPFDQALRQNIAVLAVLIGRAPADLKVRGGSLYRLAIPRVTPGLPSELLFQRPDIRAAEADLASADASVEFGPRRLLPQHLADRAGRL